MLVAAAAASELLLVMTGRVAVTDWYCQSPAEVTPLEAYDLAASLAAEDWRLSEPRPPPELLRLRWWYWPPGGLPRAPDLLLPLGPTAAGLPPRLGLGGDTSGKSVSSTRCDDDIWEEWVIVCERS